MSKADGIDYWCAWNLNETISNCFTGQTGEPYAGGYKCAFCGAWVFHNQLHTCCTFPPYPSYQPTLKPTFNPIQGEIKELLERIIELLSRE